MPPARQPEPLGDEIGALQPEAGRNSTALTYVMPPWNGSECVANLSILYADGGGGDGVPDAGAPLQFRYTSVWSSILNDSRPLVFPARGGSRLAVAGAGFTLGPHYCVFASVERPGYSTATFATALGLALLACETPFWNAAAGAAALSVLRPDGSAVAFGGANGTRERLSFTAGWDYVVPSASFDPSAGGGADLFLSGFGLDAGANYSCVFARPAAPPDAAFEIATPARALNSTTAVCKTPPLRMQLSSDPILGVLLRQADGAPVPLYNGGAVALNTSATVRVSEGRISGVKALKPCCSPP